MQDQINELYCITGLSKELVECELTTETGLSITLSGKINDVNPKVSGSIKLRRNPSLISNAWACAKTEKKFSQVRNEKTRVELRKRANIFYENAIFVASLLCRLESDSQTTLRWCSSCIERTNHQYVTRGWLEVQLSICKGCGSPTAHCADPSCKNMAEVIAKFGLQKLPKFCAEHRHDIPDFTKSKTKIRALSDFRKVMKPAKPNYSRGTKIAGGSGIFTAITVASVGAATPAIGGIVGTLTMPGLYGAAATSHGLAILGGGAIASNGLGFGMAGGTLLLTAVGGMLGGLLGYKTSTAYLGEDKSFDIKLIRKGIGTPIVVVNGFLTEQKSDATPWKNLVNTKYPEAPIYLIKWGSKELKDLGAFAGGHASKSVIKIGMKELAKTASKAAPAAINQMFLPITAAALADNPWSVAKSRAVKTGVILADLMARTKESNFIILGHSLGASVALVAAEVLATKTDAPKIEELHLFGAAVSRRRNWHQLSNSMQGNLFNYHSTNDDVLRLAFRAAQGGSRAIGEVGIGSSHANLVDVSVSRKVKKHSKYFENVELR